MVKALMAVVCPKTNPVPLLHTPPIVTPTDTEKTNILKTIAACYYTHNGF